MPTMITSGHDADRQRTAPRPLAERPAGARHRRRQQRLQPAAGLVGRPALDEGRRREPGQDEPERDERELEERAGAVEVEVREQVSVDLLRVGRQARRRRSVSDSDGGPEDEAHQADPDPPRHRQRQALARASGCVGPPRPISAARDAAATGRATSGRGRGARTARRPTTNRTIATIAAGTSDAQSNWPASGWWWAVQPHQVRFATPRRPGPPPGSR